MTERTRRKFDREFKMETARLMVDGGRRASDLSRDLDIYENVLRKWRQQYLEDTHTAFPGKGRLKPEEEEIRRLRKELNDAKEERDILLLRRLNISTRPMPHMPPLDAQSISSRGSAFSRAFS